MSTTLRWEVRVYGNLVPVENQLYHELPSLVTSVDSLNTICNCIQEMNVCEGNGDILMKSLKIKAV